MKLHFEPNLPHQTKAIDAVSDLFRGQEICRTEFTVTREALSPQLALAYAQNELGIGNRLTLLDEQILKNLSDIQMRNGLPPSASLASGDFTVEMETGTGKTYVYLRTIFELNKDYGFTKFVIVVPSVAIKEGVYKTLQITEEHFRAQYAGVPYEYFLYDSSKLGQVRNFATSPHIQIMVVTVGAINKKDVNNLYKESEKIGGERPIDLVKAARPIIVVDEPQSVDGGIQGRGKAALDAMNPLCTLRYSATHVDRHHMVYRLDAVDAYEEKLVKQISVAGGIVEDAHNKPFVRLVSVNNQRGVITARVEVSVETASGVKRQECTVYDGDDLEQVTGRSIYANWRIGEIRVAKDDEYMELRMPGTEHFLVPGESYGGVDASSVQREMIRRTIHEHLDKEVRLRPQGIKVLSLFFIDRVDKYRKYDNDGNRVNGEYAEIFEEEYARAVKLPKYQTLFEGTELTQPAEAVHNGYFSIDRKKIGEKTVEVFKDTHGDSKADDDTYNLIMREKEKLLSFDTPLKFIFSHSALREGWDNPNVFQICTLREIQTETERRQTIGRGLRLCVNQDGQRIHGFEVNNLTVVAGESFQSFAENLQHEIEQDTGIRFGIVEKHQFATVVVTDAEGNLAQLGMEQSQVLWEYLKDKDYISASGKIQDTLRKALKDETFSLPEAFEGQKNQIVGALKKLAGRLEIKNADERCTIQLNKRVYVEFTALWDRIKHKTTYRVEFDNEKLIEACIKALRNAPAIPRTTMQWRKADLAIGKGGVMITEKEGSQTVVLDEGDIVLPDILTELQDRTQLTRRTIYRVLIESGRLDEFRRNPQQFIEIAAKAINRSKQLAMVDGIKYQRLGDEYYYAQELFEQKELTGYLTNMLEAKKTVYEQVVYDSGTERAFAEAMERNVAVKVYAKLPGWFEVPTPLGKYNPDWAVLIEQDGEERLYFVVETKGAKGGLLMDDLRNPERGKINCGRAHFEALQVGESPVRYEVKRTLDDLLKAI